MCLLLIYYLHIYLFFVPIISTDCWGQFVWISRPLVSCSPGLSPAARCRCRDLGREPWQVISVMSEGRRHYGQPQGSLQLFEADSFFVDESCIMQPISNLVKKVKHNKCSNQNCIIGGAHKWPILEFFSAQDGVICEHPNSILRWIYQNIEIEDVMTILSPENQVWIIKWHALKSAPWLSGILCETYPRVWQYQPHSDLPGVFEAPRPESESLVWAELWRRWNW